MPSRRRQALLLALSAGLSRFTIDREISPHDEGLMLQAAARLAAGQRPYRDFWANYPPGQPLVLAALRRLRGPSLRDWRTLRVGVDATTALLAYRLARRRAPEGLALLAWLGAAGAMAFPTGPGPNPPALALGLGALTQARRRPLRAGALAGLATLFRLEIGLAATAGVTLDAPRGRRGAGTAAALAVAGAALAPFAAADPRAALQDTIGFARIQHLQRLPLPVGYDGPRRPSKLVEFHYPLILLAGLGLWAAAAGDDDVALAPLALIGAGYLLGRTDEFHLVPLSAVLPVMLARAAGARRRGPARTVLSAALLLVASHGPERRAGQARHPPPLAEVPGAAGRGVHTSPTDARALAGLIEQVHTLTQPGEAIFVANPRHDLVRAGNPLLYVILDRPNATRYDVMQPGLITTEPVQREIVRALADVNVIVRWLDPTASAPEPNGAGRSSGVRILDELLASQYREHARFGPYSVLVRTPA